MHIKKLKTMLKPSVPLFDHSDIDTTGDLLEQFSISLDNKFQRHKHIPSKPKLKRLIKNKSCSGLSTSIISTCNTNTTTTAFCSRCKKETSFLGDNDYLSASEKEVEVKKVFKNGKSLEGKVQFLVDHLDRKEEVKEKFDGKKTERLRNVKIEDESPTKLNETKDNNVSHSSPGSDQTLEAHFQSVFFARRPSIIGNNEFWLPLPGYSSIASSASEAAIINSCSENVTTVNQDPTKLNEEAEKVSDEEAKKKELGASDSLIVRLTVFLHNILKQTSKRHVKVLQASEMLDDTFAALTDEHFFKCKHDGNTFEIMDAIPLKDVQKIMVSENCVLLVLQVCRASALIEFKEFVPGYSEKTETLISLMVYALSRIKNVLLDVIRLPLLKLPTCATMHNWFVQQNEDILYTGIASAENVTHPEWDDLPAEGFMMKIGEKNRFHPVLLLMREGHLTSKCNGGCGSRGCKYSVTLEVNKKKLFGMRREDKPWPNCVRLITNHMDITFAGSDKIKADELLEKLYACVQPLEKVSVKIKVIIIVTKQSLQLFKLTLDKAPLFGAPLLNLEFFDEELDGTTCVIDSQGIEADDTDMQSNTRFHLTFPNVNEKQRFFSATSVE